MKKLIIIGAIVASCGLLLFQGNRIYDKFVQSYTKSNERIIEQVPPAILEYRIEERPKPNFKSTEDSIYWFKEDSIRQQIQIEEYSRTQRKSEVPEQYIPSQNEQRIKFWTDITASLLTSLSPLLVPFILYRKKEEN